MKIILIIFALGGFIITANLIYCQSDLSIFEDFAGKKWIGHYQDSEDSLLVHTIEWKFDLNKNILKEIKNVPEVNFYCETYYYWDYETDQIAYISLMNKEMISKGAVVINNEKLELSGKTFFQNGSQENKKTYEITGKGELKDFFFRKSKGRWLQGHFIQYSEKNN